MGSTKLIILTVAAFATIASGDVIAFGDYRDSRGFVDSTEAIHGARSHGSVSAGSPFETDQLGGLAVGPIAHPAAMPAQGDQASPYQTDDEAPLFVPRRHDLWTGVLVRTTAMVF